VTELRLGRLPVAVTDHGGDGRAVVLLPGGGRTRTDWAGFAALLRGRGYRPVAVDLRGQGDSGTAPWSWPGALSDVSTVVDALNLDRPAVVGHSLGGMVAALWAGRHPECPLCVNVDGHGNPTRLDQFAGPAGSPGYRSLIAFIGNALEELPEPLAQMMGEVDALDLFGAYRRVRAPLLVVCGTAPGSGGVLPDHLEAAWGAYRAWVWRELAALADQVPLVSVVSLPTGHDVHREDPTGLLGAVLAHLPE
jgi:pimeloyl-ACP methyl ester carboxylesterase